MSESNGVKPSIMIAALLLAGCAKQPMSNDDIIAETKKCHAAGLDAAHLSQPAMNPGVTVAIQCQPRAEK